jgi:chromosome segregation ATPase
MTAELNEQIEHLNMSIDDLLERVQMLTSALKEQRASRETAVGALAVERAAHETKMVILRKALAATVQDLEETLQLTPKYHRDERGLGSSLPAARAALRHP